MSTGPDGLELIPRGRMLLSFERPSAQSGRAPLFADLENCTALPTNGYHRVPGRPTLGSSGRVRDHRQDRKGTRWMPWHQESMKGVNGCDKPRVGAE
jgi:hypothetical protein